ncbi:MAG: adenylate/guanylate cyclase domain-containing protein, partial [Candidatus Omnitrophica bacterium]|nr:adenylate/guanylate cyclase domain-containing protein [Candidatus Omnitrophota bacterium]
MNKKRLLKLFISLSIAFTIAILFLILAKTRTYQILELKALDLRFVLKGNRTARAPILHIDIDDQSLSKLGRWPWPRSYHAKLINTLKECQAKQILMDILFMEEFKENPGEDALLSNSMSQSGITYIPSYFIEDQIGVSGKLKNLLLKDINVSVQEAAKALETDPRLLKDKMAAAKRYVVDEVVRELIREIPDISIEGLLQRIEDSRGWLLFDEEESRIRENFPNQKLSRFFVNRFARDYPAGKWPFRKEYKNLSVPIKEYIESIKGSGFIDAEPDLDGVTRKVPLFIRYEDKILPQLTVAALLDSLGVKDIEVKSNLVILKNAQVKGKTKDITIPVDEKCCMLVNWQGRWGYSFKHIPYYLILRLQEVREQLRAQLDAAPVRSQVPAGDSGAIEYLKKSETELKEKLTAMVKDKICIVGLTATGTHDLRPIPLQENYPMVGIHSNLINTVLTENFIRRKAGIFSVFIFLFTALIIGLGSLIKLWKSLLLSICYAIGYFLISFLAFAKLGLWIDLVGPEGIIIFGFSAITSFRYFTEEKEKLWIKQAFSHYLSKEVINELMDDPSRLKLGGERRNISVFFSDVRGFTNFSESHQPEEVVARLNEILTAQVGIVFKYNGTLDKFVGDELMAFFGAPGIQHKDDHPLVALRVAVEIQETMQKLQAQWIKESKDPLYIGIGINTGDMVV